MIYADFLQKKRHEGSAHGFEPLFMPDGLFDFQRALTDWAVRQGRAAIFADCGLGKTFMQLTWAENIHRKTNKPALLLTPLAVTAQTINEAEKFGIDCARSKSGAVASGIVATNYERLHLFNAGDFGAVVCDESSILKNFDGARKAAITDFMRKVPYRLLTTATAAPNDYIELGTSSEALGYLGHMDMLQRFFKNDHNNCGTKRIFGEAPKWRFKGHAERPFWRWVTSWARACRYPSDLGFDNGAFSLPPLEEQEHVVDSDYVPEGSLFGIEAGNLREQREERKQTVQQRCDIAAALVADTGKPALVWCHLNSEGDALEKLIPGAVQISGDDSDDVKEELFMAFARGDIRVLITKPKIGAWGLNFQHCAHLVYFPSHSYEQYYQSVRRCWRFGQNNTVHVDIVCTKGELKVLQNLRRKGISAGRMFVHLVEEMNNGVSINSANRLTNNEDIPTWL